MLSGKERSTLKKKIHNKDPKVYIGKNGLSENLYKEVSDILDKDEIVKIKVQNNIIEEKDEIMDKLIDKLEAEFVMDIGSVFAIYREKTENE